MAEVQALRWSQHEHSFSSAILVNITLVMLHSLWSMPANHISRCSLWENMNSLLTWQINHCTRGNDLHWACSANSQGCFEFGDAFWDDLPFSLGLMDDGWTAEGNKDAATVYTNTRSCTPEFPEICISVSRIALVDSEWQIYVTMHSRRPPPVFVLHFHSYCSAGRRECIGVTFLGTIINILIIFTPILEASYMLYCLLYTILHISGGQGDTIVYSCTR